MGLVLSGKFVVVVVVVIVFRIMAHPEANTAHAEGREIITL
jgi:hypothetical protein